MAPIPGVIAVFVSFLCVCVLAHTLFYPLTAVLVNVCDRKHKGICDIHHLNTHTSVYVDMRRNI